MLAPSQAQLLLCTATTQTVSGTCTQAAGEVNMAPYGRLFKVRNEEAQPGRIEMLFRATETRALPTPLQPTAQLCSRFTVPDRSSEESDPDM